MNEKPYIDWTAMTDKALAESIGKFVQHHRLDQNLSQEYLSKQAGVSRSTLSLLERGGKVNLSTLIQILRVLNLLYVMDVFQIQELISPIALAKLQYKQRQRASAMVAEPDLEEDLGW